MSTRAIVCGSRTFEDERLVHQVLFGLNVVHVVEGVCPFGGADKWGQTYAESYPHVLHLQFPPATQTAQGYHARNQQMADFGADICIAFIDKPLSESRGTADMIRRAKAAGIRCVVVEVDA